MARDAGDALAQEVLADELDSTRATVVDLDRSGRGGAGAILRNADREVVDAVAVEVPRRERRAEHLGGLGRIRAARGQLVEHGVGKSGLEPARRRAVAHHDGAAAGNRIAHEAAVERHAGREVVDTVAVEVAGGDSGAEELPGLGLVEEQVLVGERLPADRRQTDGGELGERRRRRGEKEAGGGDEQGGSAGRADSHAHYAKSAGRAAHGERRSPRTPSRGVTPRSWDR